MKVSIAIDKRSEEIELNDELVLAVLEQNDVTFERSGTAAVEAALERPIGTPKLEELIRAGEKIAIVTSDITRPLPSKLVLPPILKRLEAVGIKDEDILIVFALGAHRFHTEEEMRFLVGDEIFERYRCVDSDPQAMTYLGATDGGTPVSIDNRVIEADRRITLGNIEYHYFAGYSGGAKAILPGVSTREAIQANHSRMLEPGAEAGRADGNPVRLDLEEGIKKFIPIDFIVNVVLDEHKQIIHAVAGDFVEAHREGCKFLDRLYLKPIDERADIVIVSQGGWPKDLNLYQTQKALDNAKHAVKDGGVIILVGSCKEGLGEEVFEQWITEADTPDELIERIQATFELGGHKAAAIAQVLKRAEIYLVSEMERAFVRSIFMEGFDDIASAYEQAQAKFVGRGTVIVMPYGGSTLPRVKNEQSQ